MEYIALQLFNGLVNGSFYALLSLGLAVIFGVLRVVETTALNLAHKNKYGQDYVPPRPPSSAYPRP